MAPTAAASTDLPTLSHSLPFPAFGVDWIGKRKLIITGGGGASRTGIPNGVIVYEVSQAEGNTQAGSD